MYLILSYNIIKLLFFITIIYNETYHVNKGVIVSISNIASTITLAFNTLNIDVYATYHATCVY